jgi:cytochrome c oxidase assembly protein subunit 15
MLKLRQKLATLLPPLKPFSAFFSLQPPLPADLQSSSRYNPSSPSYFSCSLVLPGKEQLIGSWLLITAGCVFFMIGLGGYTRLTKSGLSMTEWKPLDVRYPRDEREWEREFEAYRRFPEYRENKGMSMESFKEIYFYEYFHRYVKVRLG